ncbi:MAG TPA: hypothetical protein VGP93_04610, partial [Polyangiaceae bacterium]|nr:hypothetical protein [Polyangiaceae bacterium]
MSGVAIGRAARRHADMNSIKTRLVFALLTTLVATLAMGGVLYFGARSLERNAQRTREANDEVRDLLSFALVAHRYMGAFGQSLGQRTLVASNERRITAKLFQGRIAGIPQPSGSSRTSLAWHELRAISADLSRELQVADALRADGKFYEAERMFNQARRNLFEQRMLPWF